MCVTLLCYNLQLTNLGITQKKKKELKIVMRLVFTKLCLGALLRLPLRQSVTLPLAAPLSLVTAEERESEERDSSSHTPFTVAPRN